MSEAPVVFIVDDDIAMRESLEFLLGSVSVPVRTFASAKDFLSTYREGERGCLLLDVRMPGLGGLDLQEILQQRGDPLPVIIMTGHADVPMAVRAMRAGALDFIEKPFDEDALLRRVRQALATEVRVEGEDDGSSQTREKYETLTPREREVMGLVLEGLLNKQAAAKLGISPKTVEQHRARVMEKMQAEHLAELVRMGVELGLP